MEIFECEFFVHLLGSVEKHATIGRRAGIDPNLRPCDSGAALQPTELQRPVVKL